MDYFLLTRTFWDFAFENPEKIKPNHCALYLFIVEHCNRLGWKKKFGLPTTMAKDAIGIRSYNTYINTLNDLVSFGLIELIEVSKNQYSSNIVAISNFNKALDKALDKAFINHVTKQCESTVQSIDSIDKQDTNIQDNKIYKCFLHLEISNIEFNKLLDLGYSKNQIDKVLEDIENYTPNKKYKSLYLTAKKWLQKEKPLETDPEKTIDFDAFLNYFKSVYKKCHLVNIPEATKKRFLELLQCGYTKNQLMFAIKNSYKDEYNRDKINIETFSFSGGLEKYLNFKEDRL